MRLVAWVGLALAADPLDTLLRESHKHGTTALIV